MNTSSTLTEEYKSGSRNFQGRSLGGVNLGWANLEQADFRNADFYGANLSGASFKQADLSGKTNLAFTDLSRADLTAVDLRGANLEGANLEGTVLANAVYDEQTIFPRGFDPETAGAIAAASASELKPEPIAQKQSAAVDTTVLKEEQSAHQSVNPNQQLDSSLSSVQPEPTTSATLESAGPASRKEAGKRDLRLWFIGLGLGLGIPVAGLIVLSKSNPELLTNQTTISSSDTFGQNGNSNSDSQIANAPTGLSRTTPVEAPSPKPSESIQLDDRSTGQITKQEAIVLLENWLKAKTTIFGPTYDEQLVSRFTTGSVYAEIMAADGSLSWLKQNNGYYRYGKQEVIPSGNFESKDGQATVDARIIEELFYYSGGTLEKSWTNNQDYQFTLKFEDSQWKISGRRKISD